MTDNTQEALDFVDFVNASPTPYHVVHSVKAELAAHGFVQLLERDAWSIDTLKKSGKYFVTRNGSSLIAFTVGGQHAAGDGFAIIGAHTDSPCLRIKPISKRTTEGFIQVGVEQYGGLIAHTWFDRDLSIAGRVYVKDGHKYVPRLVKIDKPLLRIPTLAIHLNREANQKFEFNKEDKLLPIAGQTAHSCADDPELQMSPEQFQSVQSVVQRHHVGIINLVAKQLQVEVNQIEDFELLLYDTQKSVIGGLNDEFIFSPRLDNQESCFCATRGLIASTTSLEAQTGIRVISLFDHEEVGSKSAQGADSSFLPDVLHRLTVASSFYEAMSKSFVLSSDMAHGVHPNYKANYEDKNKPELNKGPVIKVNANQRYSTNSPGIVLLKRLGEDAEIPLQLFVVRNDSPCGSTIGPFLASKLGIRTLDLGNPQLSMHSIRETGGTFDIEKLVRLFRCFCERYHQLEAVIHADG
ncbi:aspartyl aminopeptidase [Yamadazyma tenuis]|uniref:aspartyl aminopeptidase n=1 Tax=Candida tenuis (strain ATCC 10573 / BCRC 21748 / CBS 615 / JCM 9827 / NBRC 10315 / NRRL Y-1498 / VKM Y-70) TaxID=590646 RepID=G3B356_CANTC|nr:aspartyl aminopeptidase [Yamadazyma tenuis ATCC 10573]EGV64085.1 aspartyl aminopeptidase [Yamadazyma tenuis ATCC 10573]WEJ96280.1 aspartyl aminopeptidase [Yamadazyma tenuis]